MLEILGAAKLVEFTLTVASATISPGPNFLMVVRCSAHHTRMAGVMMALGMGVGMIVHCALILLGLNVIFTYYPPPIFGGRFFDLYGRQKYFFQKQGAFSLECVSCIDSGGKLGRISTGVFDTYHQSFSLFIHHKYAQLVSVAYPGD